MLTIITLLIGICFSVFGLLTLFSSRFVTYMRKTFWYRSELDRTIFPANWSRMDEIVNIALPMICTGVALLALSYHLLTQ